MGNRPSLSSLKKRGKAQKLLDASAALPADASGIATAEQQQQAAAAGSGSGQLHPSTPGTARLSAELKETPRGDAKEEESSEQTNNQASNQGEDGDNEGEEDPLQFFRRLSSLSAGEPDGNERGSQDLFMSYTQALLLKEGGDYAAASTLLRLVRNYKSLEIEAHYHLAECLMMLDPELWCFTDEILQCLEKVCNAVRSPTAILDVEDVAAWEQMKRESTELLAHVLVSQNQMKRAKCLYETLREEDEEDSNSDNQYEDQQSVRSFQMAHCELALGDVERAHEELTTVDCRKSLPLAHVDAQAMRQVVARMIRSGDIKNGRGDRHSKAGNGAGGGGSATPPLSAESPMTHELLSSDMVTSAAAAVVVLVDDSEGEDEDPEQEDAAVDIVRFAASKVAAVVGLHEYGDPVEEFLEYLYQDREELLDADAQKLSLTVVSKDVELDALVTKTGTSLAPQLREILKWTSERKAPPAQLAKARELLASVDALLDSAQKKRTLGAQDAQKAKKMLRQKIHHSVGVRNENLALKSYEKQHGCGVRLTNENFYFLKFPPLPSSLSVDAADRRNVFAMVDAKTQRLVVPKGRSLGAQLAVDVINVDEDDDTKDNQMRESDACYFSICGMIDGVTDALTIAVDDEDDWTLTPIVVEVKNRMRVFRDPPPLHDQIQMAVYMKMLQLTQGDLVQCLNSDRASIKVSRISLSEHPLSSRSLDELANAGGGDQQQEMSGDLWTSVVLPRLYQYTTTIHKLRRNELLRLAFLNGSPKERLEILQRECEFL